ncbi:unnamed protein product [Fusarium graminearum]|nr:unnamed protein product [Fusarium graminearum]VTO88553.1 unnamed protein product [Fusarium graminearum]
MTKKKKKRNKKNGSAFVRNKQQRLKWSEKKELKRWERNKWPMSGEKMKRAERKTLWAYIHWSAGRMAR